MNERIPAQLEILNELRKVSEELDLYVKQNTFEVKAKLVELLRDEESKAISNYERERDWISKGKRWKG